MDYFAPYGYPDTNKIFQFAQMGLVPSPIFRRQIEKDLMQSQGWNYGYNGSYSPPLQSTNPRRLSKRLNKDCASAQSAGQSWNESIPNWPWLFNPGLNPSAPTYAQMMPSATLLVAQQASPSTAMATSGLVEDDDITLRLSEDDTSANCEDRGKNRRQGSESPQREAPPTTRSSARRTRRDWEKANSRCRSLPSRPERPFEHRSRHSGSGSRQHMWGYSPNRRCEFNGWRPRYTGRDVLTPNDRRRSEHDAHGRSSSFRRDTYNKARGPRRSIYISNKSEFDLRHSNSFLREPSLAESSAFDLAQKSRHEDQKKGLKSEDSRSQKPSSWTNESSKKDQKSRPEQRLSTPESTVPCQADINFDTVTINVAEIPLPRSGCAVSNVVECSGVAAPEASDEIGVSTRRGLATVALTHPGLSPDTSIVKVEPIDLKSLSLVSDTISTTEKPTRRRSPVKLCSPAKMESVEIKLPQSSKSVESLHNESKTSDLPSTPVKPDSSPNSLPNNETSNEQPLKMKKRLLSELKALECPDFLFKSENSTPMLINSAVSPRTRRSTALELKTSPQNKRETRNSTELRTCLLSCPSLLYKDQSSQPLKALENSSKRKKEKRTSQLSSTSFVLPHAEQLFNEQDSRPHEAVENPSKKRKESISKVNPSVRDDVLQTAKRLSADVSTKPTEEGDPGTPKVLRSGKEVITSDRKASSKKLSPSKSTEPGPYVSGLQLEVKENRSGVVRRIYSVSPGKASQSVAGEPSTTTSAAAPTPDREDSVQRPVVFLELLPEPRLQQMLGDEAGVGDSDASSRKAKVNPIPSPNKKRPRSNAASPKELTSLEKKSICADVMVSSPNVAMVKKQLFGDTEPAEDGNIGMESAPGAGDKKRRRGRPKLCKQRRQTSKQDETSKGRKVLGCYYCPLLGESFFRHPVQSKVPQEKWWKWLHPRQMKYLATKMLENTALCLNFSDEADCLGEWDIMWQKWAAHLNSLCYSETTKLNTGLRMTVAEWKLLWLTYKENLCNIILSMTNEERVHNLSMLEILLFSEDLFHAVKESKGECLGPSCPRKWCVGSCKSIGPYTG